MYKTVIGPDPTPCQEPPVTAPIIAKRKTVIDPVTEFKSRITHLQPGETLDYHTGHLAADAASSSSVSNIQMFTHGLYLIGKASLRQKRGKKWEPSADLVEHPEGGFWTYPTTYTIRIAAPILPADFDVARKAHLDSLL